MSSQPDAAEAEADSNEIEVKSEDLMDIISGDSQSEPGEGTKNSDSSLEIME